MLFSNSDPIEINKFSAMAEEWWDPTGPCRPLHVINPVRLLFLKTYVPSLQEQKVIDVGCGGGLLSEALAREGACVTGIDTSDMLIEVAKQHVNQDVLNVRYLNEDAEIMSEKERGCFHVVCCMELLEHVPDPSALIQTCSDLVTPGGWLFFSTINRDLCAYLAAIVCAEYLLKLLPKGTHQYEKFIRPSELAAAARKAGLSLQKLQGIHYNPLTHVASLTNAIRVNYIAAFQKRV